MRSNADYSASLQVHDRLRTPRVQWDAGWTADGRVLQEV